MYFFDKYFFLFIFSILYFDYRVSPLLTPPRSSPPPHPSNFLLFLKTKPKIK